MKLWWALFGALSVWLLGCGTRSEGGTEASRKAAAPWALAAAERVAARDPTLRARLAPSDDGFAQHLGHYASAGFRKPRLGSFFTLGARVDAGNARAPIELGIGNSQSYLMRWYAQSAQDVAGQVSGGRVVFDNAYPDASLVLAAGLGECELSILLARPSAPQTYRFRVELGSGFSDLRPAADGALEVLDSGKNARLVIERPFAIDARGERRTVEMSYVAGELLLRVDSRGLSFPVLIDPAVKPAVWNKLKSPGLTQRAAPAVGYDPIRKETILFGGTDGADQGDTWAWDGTRWTLKATTGPLPRDTAAMAWDAKRQVLFMYGGYISGTWSNETWEWDGLTWTLRSPPTLPPVLVYPVAVAFRGKLLVLGRTSGSTGPIRILAWDGSKYEEEQPATTAPSVGQYRSSVVVDPARDRVVMLQAAVNAVSEWDGLDWITKSLSTGLDGWNFGGYVNGKVTFVTTGGKGVSTTRTWDGSQLSVVPSASTVPDFWNADAAVDSTSGHLLVASGNNQGAKGYSSALWDFDGTTWTRLAPDQAPHSRQNTALSYDPLRKKTLVVGGNWSSQLNTGELWSYDGASWTLETQQDAFSCGTRTPGAVWDDALGATVIHNCLTNATVLWDGSTLQPVYGTQPAAGRLAYDSKRKIVVLSAYPKTWEFDGSVWAEVTTNTQEQAIADGLVYDPVRGYTLLIGGSPAYQTWAYDGFDWKQLAPGTQPDNLGSSGQGAALLFNPLRQRPLYVPRGGAGITRAPWEWDGSTWSAQPASGIPPTSIVGSAAYDAQRGRVVYFGEPTDSAIYELNLRGGPCAKDSECDTGHCVDGVCCESATCGTCEACNFGTQAGVCATTVDASDPDTCPAPSTCGVNGSCGKARGATCADASECGSGFCVDGVCCDSACTGGCNRCDLLGKIGTCTAVASGDSGKDPSCAPYLCRGQEGCPSTCSANTDCVGAGSKCVSGACQAFKADGQTCALATECGSGNCAGGVCCDKPCTDLCQSCSVGDTGVPTGTCAPRPDGTACGSASCDAGQAVGQQCVAGTCKNATRLCSPFVCSASGCATSCADDNGCVPGSHCAKAPRADKGDCAGSNTSGTGCKRGSDCASGFCADGVCCDSACNGTCEACSADRKADGSPSGSCGVAVPGSACGATTCYVGQLSGALCNAQGNCVQSAAQCIPYQCDAQALGCRATCGSDADCQAGFSCKDSRCTGVLPNGASCKYALQCAEGNCVGGVCCNSACDGACDSCSEPQALGTCSVVAKGAPGAPSCRPYLCDGQSRDCPESCSNDSECVGLPCVKGECQKLEQGSACGADAECKTGHCVDGVCCESACTGCKACTKLARGGGDAEDGVCDNVISHHDPHDACQAEDPTTCGLDGYCDGAGTCELTAQNTACGGASTCQENYVIGNVCDGRGSCQATPQGGVSCAPAQCVNGACATPCSVDTCLFGTQCNPETGHCDGTFALGAACSSDYQCMGTQGSVHCVDGVCCDSPCNGSCVACDLPDKKGTCSPVPEGDQPHGDTRAACLGAGTVCAGACNGTDDACAYPSDVCDTSCEAGSLTTTSCANGACASQSSPSACPSNLGCDAAGKACLDSCETAADCAPGFECQGSKCVPQPTGRCIDDATLEVTSDQRRINCVAYKCQADRCKESCATVDDCQTGFVCDTSGRCLLSEQALAATTGSAPSKDGGCGCRLAGAGPERSSRHGGWLALGLLALRRRKRGRSGANLQGSASIPA
jgi:hypothetical protein